jgi:uncharacterized RDD family membrane protein YckC
MDAASNILDKFIAYVINPAILLIFAAGFAYFMFGMVMFMWNLRGGEASQEGKRHMLWGIIGMFIMVSVYGIIKIVDETFGFGSLAPGGAGTNAGRLDEIAPPVNFGGR